VKEPKLSFAQPAASVKLGSKLPSDAARHQCDMMGGQRLVVDVGRIGGSEDPSCKHQTYQPFVHFAPLGIRGALLGKSDP
jgi:hypothetical protein